MCSEIASGSLPKKGLSRREFLKNSARAITLFSAAVLTEQSIVKIIKNIAKNHPQRNDSLHFFWQQLPASDIYRENHWDSSKINTKLKDILPEDKSLGDAFVLGEGVEYSGSNNSFPHGSLIKVPIAVRVIGGQKQISQTDLYNLLINSSSETQQLLLNHELTGKNIPPTPENRESLIKEITDGFEMHNTDASSGSMADYQLFWSRLVNGNLLNPQHTAGLLKLMSDDKCGGSGHYAVPNFCIIPSIPELTVSGKIGIMPYGQNNEDTVYSEIWSIFKGSDFSKPIISAGAFFRQQSMAPAGEALTRLWHLHQLTSALALRA